MMPAKSVARKGREGVDERRRKWAEGNGQKGCSRSAVWLETIKEPVGAHASLLESKVIVDPSNPLGFDESGEIIRMPPADQSSGTVVAALLPAGAHYVKAFGRWLRMRLRAPRTCGAGIGDRKYQDI
jgi:hypothetical protein